MCCDCDLRAAELERRMQLLKSQEAGIVRRMEQARFEGRLNEEAVIRDNELAPLRNRMRGMK